MTALAIEVDRVINRLSSPAREELEDVVRAALTHAERKAAWDGVPKDARGYPVGYFEETAGCFANEPFDEPEELPLPPAKTW